MDTIKTNRYAAACADCKGWIPADKGVLSKESGKYIVRHIDTCPPVTPRSVQTNAEPGYYVRKDGRAIVVVENKAGTRTYGKILNFPAEGGRPSWDYMPGAGYSVADLTPMTAADAAELGLSHGYCIRCCAPLGGETLSAAVSALVGYGETCAKHMGWPYPKGVKAQRERLAVAS